MIQGTGKIDISHETVVEALQAHFDKALVDGSKVQVLAVKSVKGWDDITKTEMPDRFLIEVTRAGLAAQGT